MTCPHIVDPSWVPEDGTDLAPEGVYFTDEQIAEFFNSPELGPQSHRVEPAPGRAQPQNAPAPDPAEPRRVPHTA